MSNISLHRLGFAVALAILIVGAASLGVQAQPPSEPIPTLESIFFYSQNTKLTGLPVPAGTVVRAWVVRNGVQCGQFAVVDEGSYGLMACYKDDPTTPAEEGWKEGDSIRFTINDQAADRVFAIPSNPPRGARYQLDLQAPSGPEPLVIPEPATIALFGAGLAGLAGYVRRRRSAGKNG